MSEPNHTFWKRNSECTEWHDKAQESVCPGDFPLLALFQTVFLLQSGTFPLKHAPLQSSRMLSRPCPSCTHHLAAAAVRAHLSLATAAQLLPNWKMPLLLKGSQRSQPLPALDQLFCLFFFFLAEVLQLQNDRLLFLICVGKSTPQPKFAGELSSFF